MEFEELYQEIILDHYRSPRNRCSEQEATGGNCVKHENPLCGDELLLSVELDGDGRKIARVCFAGHGCSISQASASMMTEAVLGMERCQALAMVDRVRAMMHGEPPDEDLGDAEALQGVSKFPVRIKCALLAWLALKSSLENGNHLAEKNHEHG
ncbi:MAG: SUF system NifU family Fe-S cluster assembly protein [Candidatus Glassbacteria bacterium]|nr:SUF system NifU family Fe-S cluster assembly protein [Candidatus Glassbacteria bacterium]